MQKNDFIFLQNSHTIHLKPDGAICNRLKAVLRFTFVKLKASGQILVGEMGEKKVGLNFSESNLVSFTNKRCI